MRTVIAIAYAMLITALSLSAQSTYYWYGGKRVPLEELHTKRFVLLEEPGDSVGLSKRLAPHAINVTRYDRTNIFTSSLTSRFAQGAGMGCC